MFISSFTFPTSRFESQRCSLCECYRVQKTKNFPVEVSPGRFFGNRASQVSAPATATSRISSVLFHLSCILFRIIASVNIVTKKTIIRNRNTNKRTCDEKVMLEAVSTAAAAAAASCFSSCSQCDTGMSVGAAAEAARAASSFFSSSLEV